MSSPRKRMAPLRARRRPMMLRMSVLLPTPLRPSTPTISAPATSMLTPCSTSPVA